MKYLLVVLLMIISATEMFAQRTVSGTIFDKNSQGIEGVKVCVKNCDVKTYTNVSGQYSIVVPEGSKTLELSKSGYRVQSLDITDGEVNTTLIFIADVVDLFELSLEELLDMSVVSSSKFAQKQSLAPNVITVFKKETLNDFGWRSMNDVLYKQAGFFPSQDYERATVGSRGVTEGWNNNHLLLLVDGMPFNTNSYGTAITNEFTPMVFTKTFEIIKGPGSALYGSNATNGVLTLNTVSASDFASDKIFANVRYGEQNTASYDILATVQGKYFDVTTSLSYNSTDGEKYQSYDGSGEIDPQTNTLKQFEPKYDRFSGYLFFKLEGNEGLKGLSLQYHSQLTDAQTGHGWLWNVSDKSERIRDNYNSLVLKYQKDITENISSEIAMKYTRQNINWDMWYYRSNAFAGSYPDGANEYLKTSFDDLFTRLQFIFKLPQKSIFLVAVEPNFFMYSGDKEHYSNFNLLPNYEAYGQNRPLGPYLARVDNKTVKNVGGFAQYSSGDLLGQRVQVTAGLRYDTEFFDYIDVSQPEKPIKSKSYQEFSPRISLVIVPTEKMTIKLLGVTAFRAPSPTEVFGYNTWAIASNIDQLKSERIKSGEVEVGYKLSKYLSCRVNSYYTVTTGQIGYSIGNANLSTNIYDLTNGGVEGELLFTQGKLSMFSNVSYVKRLDEKIYGSELQYVSLSKDRLTWAPAFTANAGVSHGIKSFKLSLQGHYQGEVLRRDKDAYSASELTGMGLTSQPRPDAVAAWVSFDSQITYKYKFVEFGISGKNILDSKNYLIKTMKYPFDYKMEGRRISFVLSFEI